MPHTVSNSPCAACVGGSARRAPAVPLRSAARVVWATLSGTTPGAAAGARAHRLAWHAQRREQWVGPPLNASLSTLVAGERGGARLILIHGTPGSALGWADYLLDPPTGCEVVALDRPGFGESAPRHAVTSHHAQAVAVAALLPSDGRPVVLLGHSLGGAVAARVAAEHPTRVTALILLAASLDPELEAVHALQRIGDWAPLRSVLPRALRNSNRELLALRAELETLAPLLPRIGAAVSIVHGMKDPLVPVANVAYMQAALRGARRQRTRLIEGGDHFLPWNAAATVREAIHLALRDARELAC
jgi:pimeloyl-ACP methyl ester carboxylesterase